MWQRLKHFFLINIIFFFFNISHGAPLSFSRNARTFETVQSSLFVKSMGHVCLTTINIPDSLPCNPANLVLQKKPKVEIDILLSNGYSTLSRVRDLLSNKVDQNLINDLFSSNNIIQIESNNEINFKSKYLNARYTPLTVKGFTVVRNEANPDIEVSMVEEKGFTFQTGYELAPHFFMGLQVRNTDRKFIRQKFKLTLLGTSEGNNILKPKTQSATYFEPGATWIFSNFWKMRVSLLVTNMGILSERFEELDLPIDTQLGIGFSPPMPWGELEFSLEQKKLSYEEEGLEKLRIGTNYRFGVMNLAAGIDSNGVSTGVFYGLSQMNAGIMYSTTKITNNDENFFTQTVYVQFGWQI